MNDVSTIRLYVMRALYLLIFVGLGSMMWPRLLQHGPWGLMQGVAFVLLASLALLMGVGIRYPLQMLPVLFLELLWKTLWLLAIGLPLWHAHALDADSTSTARECLAGVVLCVVAIPWRYVWANYVRRKGDRWGRRGVDRVGSQPGLTTASDA